jgi:hypothetical protein
MKKRISLLSIATVLLISANADFSRDSKTSIVSDSYSGLMWQDNMEAETKTLNWEKAIDYCENMTLGGYSDWRLPNINELLTIVDYTSKETYMNKHFMYFKTNYYWSSTVYNGTYPWFVYFDSGSSNYYNNKTVSYYVRCVRGGQSVSSVISSSSVTTSSSSSTSSVDCPTCVTSSSSSTYTKTDIDNAIKNTKQQCKDNPESCGISTCNTSAIYTQSELDAKVSTATSSAKTEQMTICKNNPEICGIPKATTTTTTSTSCEENILANVVNGKWNMIGAIGDDCTRSGIKSYGTNVVVYPYDATNGAYTTDENIKKGVGFWLKGTFIPKLPEPPSINDYFKIYYK